MIEILKTNTNTFGLKSVNKISPKLAKMLIGFMKKAKFFFQWKSIAKEAENDIEAFFAQKPLFTYVEIETINRCNSDCSFCPVNKNDDPRPFAKMSEEIFKKIIDNLVSLNFDGAISYFSNNEPLMDTRITDFIKYGVEKLPNCRHQLMTNGTLLNEEKFQVLIDSKLNYLLIDNYNDKLKLIESVQKIYDKYSKIDFSMDCKIDLRFKNQVLSSRAGSAPNKKQTLKAIDAKCYNPFWQLIIRADCGVSLCCNDALGKTTIGNVEMQNLEDIWLGEKHQKILESIRKNKRNNIDICKHCDVVYFKKPLTSFGELKL